MIKRIVTSIVAFCVLLPVLIFSETMVFPIAIAVCAAIGCYEMFSCIGLKKNIILTFPVYIAAFCMPILKRLITTNGFVKLALCISGIIILYMMGVAVFQNKTVSVTDVGLSFTACFYIVAAFVGIVYLHDNVEYGKYIYLLTFICAWTTDTFAYFTGRFLGKHKLIPEVSPKKTVEGAVGGIVFCVAATVIFGAVIVNFFNPTGSIKANYLILAVSGVFISVVSQLGDLIMSLIKRHYGIKDYGKIFPGHGGILDRFDSVIAVSIMLTFICAYFDLLV